MNNKEVLFLALKILNQENGVNCTTMQKNLKEGVVYPFFKGVEIVDDSIVVPESHSELYSQNGLRVNISAIVGENGAGKSTIIDYLLRLLNNLATYVFGEEYRTPGAEHLHYVFGIYASLYIKVGEYVFSITCMDRRIVVYRYYYDEAVKAFRPNTAQPIIKDNLDPKKIVNKANREVLGVLNEFCYTIVTNYSLYSLCAVNYKDENTDYHKEQEIRIRGKKNGYEVSTLSELLKISKERKTSRASYYDAQCWLQGLFYKNDGYQAPIVISPMRSYGRIDLQKEHKLAKERLVSLIFLKNTEGCLFFNRINEKLLIENVTISKDTGEEIKYKNIDNVPDYLGGMNMPTYRDVIGTITHVIGNEVGIAGSRKDHIGLTWNYIAVKFIKLVFTYPRYVKYRRLLQSIKTDIDAHQQKELVELVRYVLKDHSHVTRKLYRSINYLKYEHIDNKKSLNVAKFSEVIEKLVADEKDKSIYSPQLVDELLPPPIYYIDFDLYDVNDTVRENKIKFSTLSSGEKQITYTLSSFYYQLANIDSSGYIKEPSGSPFKILGSINLEEWEYPTPVVYKHVCAVFDEVELYFHPEMQRLFISTLLDGLNQFKFRQVESIHFLVATHSPFILSDIPSSNVLFLSKEGKPKEMTEFYTFGANIHSMLRHSFFLHDGSIGEYARQKISETLNTINRYVIWHEYENIMHSQGNLREIDEKIEYLKASNYKQLKALPEDFFVKWLTGESTDESDNEAKDLKKVEDTIAIIQEPLVKTIMTEQLEKWKSYVVH